MEGILDGEPQVKNTPSNTKKIRMRMSAGTLTERDGKTHR
jgi:hypothetical protein